MLQAPFLECSQARNIPTAVFIQNHLQNEEKVGLKKCFWNTESWDLQFIKLLSKWIQCNKRHSGIDHIWFSPDTPPYCIALHAIYYCPSPEFNFGDLVDNIFPVICTNPPWEQFEKCINPKTIAENWTRKQSCAIWRDESAARAWCERHTTWRKRHGSVTGAWCHNVKNTIYKLL